MALNPAHIARHSSIVIMILLLLCSSAGLLAQEQEKVFVQDDIFRIFSNAKKIAQRDSAAAAAPARKEMLYAVTPFIGYNPAYGVLVGVGASIGTYLGDPVTTPISSANLVINLTTEAQKIFNFRTNIYTEGSTYILRGDWRLLLFSQPTYGLGSGIRHTGAERVSEVASSDTDSYRGIKQPLNYNYIRLYESAYRRINGQFYLGLGYCLDRFTDIDDHKLDLDTVPQQITSHYQYSKTNGFKITDQTISGLSLNALYDNRNSTIRPTRGYFALLELRSNFKFLGSWRNSYMINTEFRTYLPLSRRRPDHLIGFWYMGQFTRKGHVPYLALPAVAWDMYNRMGRGYIQGSTRGISLLYAETEYRFPISRYTGILGGVLFVNANTANSDDGTHPMFKYVDPAAGCGLRVMLNRKTLSNIAIDVGVGRNGTIAVYFNLNETF